MIRFAPRLGLPSRQKRPARVVALPARFGRVWPCSGLRTSLGVIFSRMKPVRDAGTGRGRMAGGIEGVGMGVSVDCAIVAAISRVQQCWSEVQRPQVQAGQDGLLPFSFASAPPQLSPKPSASHLLRPALSTRPVSSHQGLERVAASLSKDLGFRGLLYQEREDIAFAGELAHPLIRPNADRYTGVPGSLLAVMPPRRWTCAVRCT